MANYVYVFVEISAANSFAELLIKNGYSASSMYATKLEPTLNVFAVYTGRKEFYRFYNTEAECLTVEEFIDLFL